jgi:hypothetical protein
MPSTSWKQHKFMEAIKHSPEFASKAGVPQKVGKDFAAADDKAGITKSHAYAEGGKVKTFPIPSSPAPSGGERKPEPDAPKEGQKDWSFASGGAVQNDSTRYSK